MISRIRNLVTGAARGGARPRGRARPAGRRPPAGRRAPAGRGSPAGKGGGLLSTATRLLRRR